jgi:hypothetical protein
MDLSYEFFGRAPQNAWAETLLLIIISMTGIVLSIFFYLKSRKKRKPFYSSRSFNIAQDISPARFESLVLTYNETRIENFTITKVLFWNDGKETIRIGDVAIEEPLEIVTEGDVQILDAAVIQRIPPTNGFEVRVSGNQSSVELSFDYIDKDEGAVVQIVHTGKSGRDISMRGRIAGGGMPVLKEFTEESIPRYYRHFRRILSINQFKRLIGIFFLAASVSIFVLSWRSSNGIDLGAILLVILLIIAGISYSRREIPDGFDTFWQEL